MESEGTGDGGSGIAYGEQREKSPREKAVYWCEQIRLAEKYFKRWRSMADRCERRYRNESKSSIGEQLDDATYPIFWSNIKTLQPALYARTPKPQVERRWKDNDPLGRVASQLLERSLDFNLQAQDFDSAMRDIRDDLLLGGRGTGWIRYEPTFGMMTDPATGMEYEGIIDERLYLDYVAPDDFLHNPCRRWDKTEVEWVARRTFLTRDEMKRFAAEDFDPSDVPLDFTPKNIHDEGDGYLRDRNEADCKKTSVWEIWCAKTRTVITIAPAFRERPLDEKPFPVELDSVFPVPTPLYSTRTPGSTIPVPDMIQYEHQLDELDRLTDKIATLRQALKVAGVCDASVPGLERLLSQGVDNELIPSDNFAAVRSAGGLRGAMDFLPMKEIAEALLAAYDARERTKQDIYEITGWSDIMRGQSNPNETAKAQQLKGQFATLRLAEKQQQIQEFAKSVIAIMADFMAQMFTPETFRRMAGVEVMGAEVAQNFEAALSLLKDNTLRDFRIDIETDSTIALDEQMSKQNAAELVQGMGGLIQQFLPLLQSLPMFAPVLAETMMFAARHFKAGRALEASLEGALQSLQEQMNQPPPEEAPPPPDPKQMEAEARIQFEQVRLQMEQQKAEFGLQLEQIRAQRDAELQKYRIDNDHALALQKLERDTALRAEEFRRKLELDWASASHKQTLDTKAQLLKDSPNLTLRSDGSIGAVKKTKKLVRTARDPMGNLVAEIDEVEVEEPTERASSETAAEA